MKHPDLAVCALGGASEPRPIPNDSASPYASLVGGMSWGVLPIAQLVLEPRED